VTGEGTGAVDAAAAAAAASPDAASGLDAAAVAARVKAGLVNEAPPPAGRSIAQILRANVFTRFNAILGTLFVVVVAVGPRRTRCLAWCC
jgi:cation-transporting ATPase E